MSEIHFIVEEAPERALSRAPWVRTSLPMRCTDHFDPQQMPGHIRLTSHARGEHHALIPKHDPLRIGALAFILDSMATHHGMTWDARLQQPLE